MRNVSQSDFPQSPFLWSRGTTARETLRYLDRNGVDAGAGDEHSSGQILSDERIQANRSFSSNGLLR
jgi:hypothetical protein